MSPEASAPWKVLLVDDEPAVHEISRMILNGLRFEGRDVELLVAGSAAHARELLAQHADVALALLDVVMESDDAGIQLVQHIRRTRGDRDMQIVLRTGQPGMAPEREVVAGYDINGYVLKTEITAQRLHSIVVAGLRNHARLLAVQHAQHGAEAASAAAPAEDLEAELPNLLTAGAALLQAQPEVRLADHRIRGVELVPQWRTSIGLLSAARLWQALPARDARAELLRWLVHQAAHWSRHWAAADVALGVSIPLPAAAHADATLLEALLGAVREAALPPGRLDLLVDEATFFGSDAPCARAQGGSASAAQGARRLREAGLTLTLTDFGARTVPLQRLNGLLPDRVKLSRLCVRGVAGDPPRMAVARSLIALAQTLNIVAIADGIASDADAQFFKWEGCEFGQGDALAPACAPADVLRALSQPQPPAH